MADNKMKLTDNEQNVQFIKECLSNYPMWVNEIDVIARGLVSRGIGDLKAMQAKYEQIISEKDFKIMEQGAQIEVLTGLLTQIREITCREIGIKINESEKLY